MLRTAIASPVGLGDTHAWPDREGGFDTLKGFVAQCPQAISGKNSCYSLDGAQRNPGSHSQDLDAARFIQATQQRRCVEYALREVASAKKEYLMLHTPILSSDSHVIEPPDLWLTRIALQFRYRAPHVVPAEDGDWWVVEDYVANSFQGGAQAGKRFDDPSATRTAARFADVRPGAYVPDEHLTDNETDGVYGSVLYPTVGLALYSVPDSALLSAIFQAYNDWLADFCHTAPRRLKGIAMLNVDDVHVAVRELERCRTVGLAGGMIPVYPPEAFTYDHPGYDPLWAAAQDLDMPLSLHIGSNRPLPRITPAQATNADHWVRMSLADMIFAGVFERYPRLRVGSVEQELSWVPHFLDRLDYTYTQRPRRDTWPRFRDNMLPSDFFRRQVFLSFQEDMLGIRDRAMMGVDNLMWGSDYPHTEATFPYSQKILAQLFADVPIDEQERIVYTNVKRLYHFDLEVMP